MNLHHSCATIIVAVLFFFVSYSDSKDLANDAKDTLTSAASNAAKAVVPNCIFGVESVSYILYTRSNPHGVKVQQEDKRIPLHHGAPVSFIIHGFVTAANSSQFHDLIQNWLQTEDRNIFSVDWDNAACYGGLTFTDYLAYGKAVKNVPVVGENIAKFSARLAKDFGLKINEITLVGHSLGSHVAAFAGKTVQRLTNQKYKHIMSLDPAGPLYHLKGCSDRLCISDASYVQVFHTSLPYAIHDPIGHADFYFHGGSAQPGCSLSPGCDHLRAVIYASMSMLNPKCFTGTRWQVDSRTIMDTKQCNSSLCSHAGIMAPASNAHGVYYVSPRSESPFCN